MPWGFENPWDRNKKVAPQSQTPVEPEVSKPEELDVLALPFDERVEKLGAEVAAMRVRIGGEPFTPKPRTRHIGEVAASSAVIQSPFEEYEKKLSAIIKEATAQNEHAAAVVVADELVLQAS